MSGTTSYDNRSEHHLPFFSAALLHPVCQPCVVVRRVGHLARALPRRNVARSVWVGAVVEALEVLAVIPVVPRVAHASGYRKLDGAPPVERAVVWTVLVGRGLIRAESDDANDWSVDPVRSFSLCVLTRVTLAFASVRLIGGVTFSTIGALNAGCKLTTIDKH